MAELRVRNEVFDLSYRRVMGVLNITPDSFSDGGKHFELTAALARVNEMVNAGVDIIDVGGESTRPGASRISEQEELERVMPVVEAIVKRFDVWVSVDTSQPAVMREAAKIGAHMINDIRALTLPGALQAASESELSVCLMHMQGEPNTMQLAPQYNDFLREVDDFFVQRLACVERAGIARSRLLIDPGFGFGKNLSHNYQLLAHLADFHHFDLPLLVGLSRKSMIGQLLNLGPSKRLIGSVACAVIAAMQGAHIIRVHDVTETVQALRIVEATQKMKG